MSNAAIRCSRSVSLSVEIGFCMANLSTESRQLAKENSAIRMRKMGFACFSTLRF